MDDASDLREVNDLDDASDLCDANDLDDASELNIRFDRPSGEDDWRRLTTGSDCPFSEADLPRLTLRLFGQDELCPYLSFP